MMRPPVLVYPGSAHETAGTMRYAIQIDMKRVSVDRNIDGRYKMVGIIRIMIFFICAHTWLNRYKMLSLGGFF